MDFDTFIITGPDTSTLTATGLKQAGGVQAPAGKAYNLRGTCKTDSFSISDQTTVQVLCGTLTNAHGIYYST